MNTANGGRKTEKHRKVKKMAKSNKQAAISAENVMESDNVRGFFIVVLDRGFVYIGDVVYDGVSCLMTNAFNIRKWGTTQGLGELAVCGPTKDTILDEVGTLYTPDHAVISFIDTDPALWRK